MSPTMLGSDEQRQGIVVILNKLLSDEYLLCIKTRNYHWNVLEPQSGDLHKFFGLHYEELDKVVREVADQARALGGLVWGTMTEFVQHARLREDPGERPDPGLMLTNILGDHESLIRQLRMDVELCNEKFQNIGINRFLTRLMERHERMVWMFRSFLVEEDL